MLFLPKSKSYLLFALLCLTFFSCQQLIEIIEPTPPKQIEQTCRLINDVNNNGDTTRYSHNKLGRLQRTLFDQGSNTTAENRFLRNFFTYNEKNQLIRLFNVQWRQGFSHDIAYDAAGRVAKVETQEYKQSEPHFLNEYSYSQDTIRIKTTETIFVRFKSTREKMSIFEKGNLVKIRYPNQQGSYDSERALEESFSYTSILTKKSLAEKTAALIYVHPLSLYGGHMLSIHLTSKNLVSRVVDTGGRVYTYAG